MNKLKQKFESAMKSTAMSAQQIYKHKSFNLSKTQEDPEEDFLAAGSCALGGMNPAGSL